ncbi:MAG TPA: bifunctional phosphoribosyl-AMP cyclohydrolase/phosphoribosyl-ATP diphosphatase HisIE [Firmicutes bacterium]|nr:bifunctional phosphoribosyl-AMP cyclohydrolase/phosphoribosyl-ATP diphosphatase HisIE [Bacillota bacterium]
MKLWPVVVQDVENGQVLMLAYANQEALALTLKTGQGWYWSRSRRKLWRKGETSGHTQRVVSVKADCDSDALLYLVQQSGPACHTGRRSCFYKEVADASSMVSDDTQFDLDELFEVIRQRIEEKPEGSYVASLVGRGTNRVLQKIGEEAVEAVIALRELASRRDSSAEDARRWAIAELADLCFHCLIGMAHLGIQPVEVVRELAGRRRTRK